MIKFFRHIRRSLIKQNQMGKPALPDSPSGRLGRYFKYAIGEILLVVIGILIALQINNWSQQRKNRKYELTMLAQVQEQLKTDYKNCKSGLIYFKDIIHHINEVAKIKNNIDYPSDSLQHHIDEIMNFGISYSFNTSAYDGIESGGLDKISNPEIRNLLSDLYGNTIPTATAWVNEIVRESLFERSRLIYDIFDPFVVSGDDGVIKPILVVKNPEMIRKNPKFDEMLATFNWPMPIAIRVINNLLTKMERLDKLIEKELQ